MIEQSEAVRVCVKERDDAREREREREREKREIERERGGGWERERVGGGEREKKAATSSFKYSVYSRVRFIQISVG